MGMSGQDGPDSAAVKGPKGASIGAGIVVAVPGFTFVRFVVHGPVLETDTDTTSLCARVDKAKAIEAIKERKAKKEAAGQQQTGAEAGAGAGATQAAAKQQDGLAGDKAEGGGGKEGAAGGAGGKRFERHFGQRRVKADPVNDDRAPVLASDVLGLLGGGKA